MTPGPSLKKTPMTQPSVGKTEPVDAITLAVLKGRLESIVDEMDAVLFRSAFNPIIAEAHDASHGLYDAETGATLVQGQSGLPIFVGAMAFAVKSVIDKAGASGAMHPGDIYIFNDPYEGGTHLSDFKLVKPFFNEEKLFCYMASVGHWHDVGGNVPGNYNPVATESFQEGMLIPPVKLFDQGRLNQDIVDILQANSRLPDSLYGDLMGQINALKLGEERLADLLRQTEPTVIQSVFTILQERASRQMRGHIAQLPDGVYSATDYLDNDGITDAPLAIALDVTVHDDRMTLDFSRSAKATAGPVNISRSTAIAACYVALKHIFVDVPANAGVLEPIAFVIPEDSLLSVQAPKPVGGYTETILRLIDVFFQAIAIAAPEKSNAAAYGTINALSMAGYRRNGQRWVLFSFFGGGHGGHCEGDGLSHGNAPISTATIPPVEILEAAYPVLFTEWALRPDSAGSGRYRGGFGASYEVELLEDAATVFLFGERGRYAPPGIAGGGAGAVNRFTYPDGPNGALREPALTSKLDAAKITRGQRLRLETPGGGGYGRAEDRPVKDVARDVALGYMSKDQAWQTYGVRIADDGSADRAVHD